MTILVSVLAAAAVLVAPAADSGPEFISGEVTQKYFIEERFNLWTGESMHPDCYGLQVSTNGGLLDREQVCVEKTAWDAARIGSRVSGIRVLDHLNWFQKV